ncbi:hypothetical protein [Chamaesiphon sp. VAR_48_metabat_403]|uniref:hypothetical protein n=1 Tax=Chamaesiphon sp. VAR_48_metabat_403 TaxID=2964700 RepID=UPI00286E0C36|nr:hypothetical protein [Chamaesiphon sp. VAR_48_metabat_403]
MSNKLFALAMTGLLTASGAAVFSALSIVSTPLTPSANAQAQRYKVVFWYTIDQANDGVLDNVLEVYGKLKVDGNDKYEIYRSRPLSREANQDVNLTTIYVNKPSITVNATLSDVDTASADDPVFRMDGFTLNLAAFEGREKTVRYRSGQGEGATLHMQVNRVR